MPQYAQSYFYYPAKEHSGYTPKREGLAFKIVNSASADGTLLNGWPPQQGDNALVFDYPGYGHSDHTAPTPKGLFQDTQAAIRYLQNRSDIDTKKLLQS